MNPYQARLMTKILAANRDPDRPRGYKVTGRGGKGVVFRKVNEERRLRALERIGYVRQDDAGDWWVTEDGAKACGLRHPGPLAG